MTSNDALVRFDVGWDDLDVTPLRVEQALGYVQGGAPEPLPMMIQEALGEAPQRLAISAGFRVLSPLGTMVEPDGLVIHGLRFQTGRLIASLVSTADRFAVLVATAGPALDDWTKSLLTQGDPLAAYLVDGLGTVVAEQAAEWLEDKVSDWAESHGLSVTRMYGPGYCGWDVQEQHRLFSLLPPGFCGITLNESALMSPVKSISGVIGLGEGAERKAHGCAICDLSNCFRRVHAHT